MAVGKSTTSRLLQILLSRTFSNATVELVTTDGFLFPNKTLEDHGILNRKGFPESYNMELLLSFLDSIKNGQDFQIPVYSHETYDIVYCCHAAANPVPLEPCAALPPTSASPYDISDESDRVPLGRR